MRISLILEQTCFELRINCENQRTGLPWLRWLMRIVLIYCHDRVPMFLLENQKIIEDGSKIGKGNVQNVDFND